MYIYITLNHFSLLTVLIELILSEKLTTEEKAMFEKFSEEIVMKIVIPNTIWKAGRYVPICSIGETTLWYLLLDIHTTL